MMGESLWSSHLGMFESGEYQLNGGVNDEHDPYLGHGFQSINRDLHMHS